MGRRGGVGGRLRAAHREEVQKSSMQLRPEKSFLSGTDVGATAPAIQECQLFPDSEELLRTQESPLVALDR